MNEEEIKKAEEELKKCLDRASEILWRLLELNSEYCGREVPDMPITRIWADTENKKIELLPF